MTAPRRVLPNRTYLITRRCSERRFFLRPDPQVTWIFEYLLAHACERHGVELHGFVCMSNHYHLVVTDHEARLPEFQQYLNSLLARAVNCARGRWEAFWTRDSYNAVELLEDAVVLDKLAYTLLNPVRAGLVGRARAWGGATSASMRFGGCRIIARPSEFFSEDMPEHVRLELVPPPLHGDVASGLDEQLAERIDAVEQQLQKSRSKPMGDDGRVAATLEREPRDTRTPTWTRSAVRRSLCGRSDCRDCRTPTMDRDIPDRVGVFQGWEAGGRVAAGDLSHVRAARVSRCCRVGEYVE